ncbi:MAG: ABC transporter ATP-binding protein [Acutalibacter sp.]
MSETILSLQGITKSFDGTPVLRGIDLEAAQGEFITLLGSSGCGKTTTLRIIAGLESPDEGRVLLEGRDMTDAEPNKRDVNTVFQSYALFPHMTVEQNIGYALKLRKRPKGEIREEVKKMLELVQLSGFEKRKPGELSGGQKQRVAIARSLINRPKLLLLDEPLGALDLQLRRQMQQELKRLQKKLGITFIYITHDQEEALNMSDRIAVMREGRFEQIGTPAQVYDQPKTAYVARFVGEANIVKGKVGAVHGDQVEFVSGPGKASFLSRGYGFASGEEVTLAVRGEQAQAVKGEEGPGLPGVVKEKSFAGGMLRICVELSGGEDFICSRHGIDSELVPGDRVRVTWEPDHACPVDRPESGTGEA